MKVEASSLRGLLDSVEPSLLAHIRRAGATERQVVMAGDYHCKVASRQPLSRTLVELGFATDELVARWVAQAVGWSYVARDQLRGLGKFEPLLPRAIAFSRQAVALRSERGEVHIVAADPSWPQFAQVVYALQGRDVAWCVAPQPDVAALVGASYASAAAVTENQMERFVEKMFEEAAHTRGVSDIHCVPDERSCEIRWRLDGDLTPWSTVPATTRDAFVAQLKLASTRGADGRARASAASGGLDVSNHLEPQDASAVREYGTKRVSLRFSVVPSINGESIVVRILDQEAQVGSFEDLGMLADTAVRLRGALSNPNGIVFVSGPTGHGKSTTLAASVPCINVRSRRALSVEDPVEYRLRGVTQVPVGPRVSFTSALRAFLRHNPDTILVGEVRDSETAALSVRLALTGHLILTTVHANSALQAVSRMVDLGVDPSLVRATSRLLLAQRLVKRLCPSCRRVHPRSEGLLREHQTLIEAAQAQGVLGREAAAKAAFFEAGGGCEHCGRSGYLGRLGIFECLEPTLAHFRSLGLSAGVPPDARGASGGGAPVAHSLAERSLRQDGILKASMGLTSLEEVIGATLEEP